MAAGSLIFEQVFECHDKKHNTHDQSNKREHPICTLNKGIGKRGKKNGGGNGFHER